MSDAEQKPTTISDIRNDDSLAGKADFSSLPEVDPAYYTLGKEVGRGGMGRVMEARDLRVGRSVVLKELLDESPSHALRFEREARVTARLQHPAIVPIYEIGKWPDGAPFYAMRMVEGRNLRAAITEAKTLDERLALLPSVIVAAEAIAYAHAHRVIHRDLKPSNIMVGDFGETIVIDWGLAKDLGDGVPEDHDVGPYRDAGTGELTLVGAVVGTPAYMPPEQARGEVVDERGDVYSLGAILYHLLAGEAPFRAGNSEDLLEAVKAAAPESITERAPEAPRDLLSIVDKAMARDAVARYANAAELVAELVRFRTGQLVGAHRYSRGELVRRWLREHRFIVISSLTALIALAVAGVIAVVGIMRERDRADGERVVAVQQREKANDTTLALYEEEGRQLSLQGEPEKALAYLDEAYKQGRDTPALRFLLAEALKGFAGRRTLNCDAPAKGFAVSPDGQRVAVACGSLVIFDLTTGAIVARTRVAHPEFLFRLVYSHNGRLIAGGSAPTVWSAEAKQVFELVGHTGYAKLLGFTNDDQLIVTLGADSTLRSWDAKTGAQVRLMHVGVPLAGCKSVLGGDVAAVTSLHGEIEFWNVRSGERIGHVIEDKRVGAIAADRAGSAFATCGEEGAEVWTQTGQLRRAFPPRHHPYMTCFLSGDGSRMVLADTDTSNEIIDIATSSVVADLIDPRMNPIATKFDETGRYIVAGGATGTAIFDAPTGALIQRTNSSVISDSFEITNNKLIAIVHGDVVLTQVEPPKRSFDGPAHERLIGSSADGARAATRRDDGTVTIWNVDTNQPIPHAPIRQHTRQSSDDYSYNEPDVAFSSDGSLVAVVRADDLAVLDATTGKLIARLPRPSALPELEFDHAGHRLRVGRPAPAVWDVQTGRDLLRTADTDDVAAISLDGRYVLLRRGSRLEVFDVDRSVVVSTLHMTFTENTDFSATTVGVGFSSDASRIVVNEQSGENGHALVGIFDSQSGERLVGFSASSCNLSSSRELLAAGAGGGVEIRRVQDGAVLAATHDQPSSYVIFSGVPSDDGHFLLQYGDEHSRHQIVDAATGRVLARYGRGRERIKFLSAGTEESDPSGKWLPSGDGFVSPSAGIVVWPFHLEDRSAQVVDAIVRHVTPWRVVNGALASERRKVRGAISAKGSPVAGAMITVLGAYWHLPFTTATDPSGHYELELPDGEYTVSATLGNAKSSSLPFVIRFGDDTTVDLDLN